MGRKAKEKQLVAQASRRRTVLQIDRVSRREIGEVPLKTGVTRTVNPNSITGIGLLGSYGENSDDDEEEEDKQVQNLPVAEKREDEETEGAPPAASTSSTGQHPEIDAKLADFFKEIESMDADTTTSAADSGVNRQGEEAVSSTTDDYLESEEGFAPDACTGYCGNEGIMYPWQACLDDATNCYYYWNTETNEVQWYPPTLEPSAADTQAVDNEDDTEENHARAWPVNQDDEVEGPQSAAEQRENNDKLSDKVSEQSSKESTSKGNYSDNELEGFEIVDSWEDQDNDGVNPVDKIDTIPTEEDETPDTETAPMRRENMEELKGNSDDEFAAQLLEDTYEKGKQDLLDEQSMELSEDEGDKKEDKESSKDNENKSLLPPEVFEHLRTAPTKDKKESKPVIEKEEKYNTKAEEGYRLQILELSSVLTNKLDFLEVSREGMSTLKILLIEMETRIADWREGALDSHHLVQKLYEADKQLKQYEESASPPGWICHWDRTHKRYYYTNKVTGDSQWDYPSNETDRETEGSSSSAANQSIVTSDVSITHSSLPIWNIPGYVPIVQTPVLPVVMATVPVVSSSVTSESYVNPPVPGTDEGSEAVPFTASFSVTDEEPPPPPPGTDDLPPLPPVDSPAPPPPPPEPSDETLPPLPREEMAASPVVYTAKPPSVLVFREQAAVSASVFKAAPTARSLVDYSDLESVSTSAFPSDSAVEVMQSPEVQVIPAVQITREIVTPPETTGTKPKLKRKKKASKVGSALLSSKARKVSSLVQKWQSIKQQEEPGLGSSEDDGEENDPVKQFEEWKKEHIISGQAAYNPNFEEIKGDWRERIRQRQARAKTGTAAADQKET